MKDKEYKRYEGAERHQGPDHSSHYPVSRLAVPIDLVDVARQIEQADLMVSSRVSAKLKVIVDQIKSLQHEAKAVLETARHDQNLHRARCNFKRIPGHIYHLYVNKSQSTYFSMLTPADWRDAPPDTYLGSYRLEADQSWTPADKLDQEDDTQEILERLLKREGLSLLK